jgi:hypothetical protein
VPSSTYELVVDGAVVQAREAVAGSRYVFSFEEPAARVVPGPRTVVRFDGLAGGEKEFELWLPYTDAVELHELRADAGILPPAPARGLRWLHHGSSISHGYRADTTLGTWPVVAARAGGVELTSLAFSGSAMLDQLTARTMRDAAADLISLKIGINVHNMASLNERTFLPLVHGFLDTIRDGHPTTPITVISPILSPSREDDVRSERTLPDGSVEILVGDLTLRQMRTLLQSAVELRQRRGDEHLTYLDGTQLFGVDPSDVDLLPDGLHPNGDGYERIGQRYAAAVAAGEAW